MKKNMVNSQCKFLLKKRPRSELKSDKVKILTKYKLHNNKMYNSHQKKQLKSKNKFNKIITIVILNKKSNCLLKKLKELKNKSEKTIIKAKESDL